MRKILTVLLCAAAGCISFEPPAFEAKPSGAPLPYCAAFELQKPEGYPERTGGDSLSILDRTEVFQDEFFQPITRDAARVFDSVSVLQAEGADALPAAKRMRAELLVGIRPKKHEIAYAGRNGYALLNVAVWLLTWFPAWFVPDETWAADVEVEVVVRETRKGEELLRKTFKARPERNLNDFDRGWNAFGTFIGPPCTESNFHAAAFRLHPFAAVDLRRQVFEALDTELRKTLGAKGIKPLSREPGKAAAEERPLPDRLAFVVGAGGPAAKHAERDAANFAGYLVENGWTPEGVRLFKGAEATGASLEKALKEAAANPKAKEARVVVYWAGPGAMVAEGDKGVPALGPASEPLALPAFAGLLQGFKSAVLIADAGFAGPNRPRSASLEGAPSELSAAWQEFVAAAPFPVLLAASPGQPALEADDKKAGLFTSSLLEGLRGDADMDGDRVVLLGELKKFLQAQVPGLAKVLETDQTPVLAGGDDAAPLFR